MVKKLKFLFFFLPLFILTNVNALSYTNIGYWNDYVDYGQFWFHPVPESGNTNIILDGNEFIGTAFTMSNIYSADFYIYNLPSSLQPQSGVSYELEFSLPNAKFTNINQVHITPIGTGMSCSITAFDNSSEAYPKIRFICPTSYSDIKISLYSSSYSHIFTNNSFRLNYIYLRQYDSTGVDTSIIEGQNQTIINQNQTIINQQNQNTQDIIDNQNSNTDKEIESQKVCYTEIIDKNKIITDGYLTSTGTINTSEDTLGRGVSDYIYIKGATNFKNVVTSPTSAGNNWLCFYTEDKTNISCSSRSSYNNNNNITIPSSAYYVRFSLIPSENRPQFTFDICKNGNQALNDNVNNLNDTLNSEESPNTNQDINDMNDMVASDTPISDLITMPLTLINAYINGINSNCTPVNLGNLYGTNLILPCINLESRLGTNLWSMIDIFFCIFMCYNIGMLFISAFDGITSLRDDFEGLYQPRHADTGYQPKHGGGN